MHAHQICFKLYFDAHAELKLEDFVDEFHAWIRHGKIEDDLAIDVADYVHVPNGPGVLLVCHQGHLVVEHKHGRWALVYNRKRGGDKDSLQQTLRTPLQRLVRAAAWIEGASGKLQGRVQFLTQELVLRVQNRLLAPNTDHVFAQWQPAVTELLTPLYQDAPQLQRVGDSRELFTVLAKGRTSPTLAALAG